MYYIKLESLIKLNKNIYKKIRYIFILINFYIKLYIGLLYTYVSIKKISILIANNYSFK